MSIHAWCGTRARGVWASVSVEMSVLGSWGPREDMAEWGPLLRCAEGRNSDLWMEVSGEYKEGAVPTFSLSLQTG